MPTPLEKGARDVLMRQTRFRGRRRVGWMFVFSLAVYNLVRIRNLEQCPT